jgi:hypothetical protein
MYLDFREGIGAVFKENLSFLCVDANDTDEKVTARTQSDRYSWLDDVLDFLLDSRSYGGKNQREQITNNQQMQQSQIWVRKKR